MEKNKKAKSLKLKRYILIILVIIVIFLIAAYTTIPSFRTFVDNKIFKKNVTENSLATIEINSDDNPISFAYSNFIGVYTKNNLTIYDKNAKEVNALTLNITSPIISKSGKYLAIAENNGNDFYVINS